MRVGANIVMVAGQGHDHDGKRDGQDQREQAPPAAARGRIKKGRQNRHA